MGRKVIVKGDTVRMVAKRGIFGMIVNMLDFGATDRFKPVGI